VATGTVAADCEACTVTVAGTLAAAGVPLDNVTTKPPAGAGCVSETCSVLPVPPNTADGVRLTEARAAAGAAGFTMRTAGSEVPFSVALNVTCVCDCTGLVVTATSTDDPPEATWTLEADQATLLLSLVSAIVAPSGAGPESVSLSVAPCPPVIEETRKEAVCSAGAGGLRVRVVDLVTPASVAERVTVVWALTADVDTGTLAVDKPSTTTTDGATVPPPLLDRVTCVPPAGAGLLRVTVRLAPCPPVTAVGETATEDSAGVGTVDPFTAAESTFSIRDDTSTASNAEPGILRHSSAKSGQLGS